MQKISSLTLFILIVYSTPAYCAQAQEAYVIVPHPGTWALFGKLPQAEQETLTKAFGAIKNDEPCVRALCGVKNQADKEAATQDVTDFNLPLAQAQLLQTEKPLALTLNQTPLSMRGTISIKRSIEARRKAQEVILDLQERLIAGKEQMSNTLDSLKKDVANCEYYTDTIDLGEGDFIEATSDLGGIIKSSGELIIKQAAMMKTLATKANGLATDYALSLPALPKPEPKAGDSADKKDNKQA